MRLNLKMSSVGQQKPYWNYDEFRSHARKSMGRLKGLELASFMLLNPTQTALIREKAIGYIKTTIRSTIAGFDRS